MAYEWLPHPQQSDQLGLPITDGQIDAWLSMMAQWEGLLKGESLFPGAVLSSVLPEHDLKQGRNLKTLLDDPRADLFNWERIKAEGIDAKYLEAEQGKQTFNAMVIFAVFEMLNGPFGFTYVARFN